MANVATFVARTTGKRRHFVMFENYRKSKLVMSPIPDLSGYIKGVGKTTCRSLNAVKETLIDR